MGTSSEEVLSLVNYVRYKKNDGTLYLMGERMAWLPDGKDSFTVSNNYTEIKSQKISPDSKPKIQLQIVLHSGEASTFHFINPMGQESQLKDRNDVKELLQQLLPKFKRTVDQELEKKNRVLSLDPELFQLYKDLVVSQVITADEFWLHHANKKNNSEKIVNQDVGVSPAFLSEIKPQADGANGLKYNLTGDMIQSIFRTYPTVEKKFTENVPDKMSESEFWTRFFQSHYFHLDRIHGGSKDLFSECAKHDEKNLQEEIVKIIQNPLLDLTAISDSFLDEGYGTGGDLSGSNTGNATSLSIIRRFNHHSQMVLKSCENKSSALASATVDNSNHKADSNNETVAAKLYNGSGDSEEPLTKRAKIREKLECEDLINTEINFIVPLQLNKQERYYHGPTPEMHTDYRTNDDVISALQCLHEQMSEWTPNLTQGLSSKSAISVVHELSPGGALMHGISQVALNQMVTPDIQQELKQLYGALCELLRHFWACFPVSNKALEEKVVRMNDTLQRFESAKLQPFENNILREHHTQLNLTGHLNDMLKAAYNRYNSWQMNKLNKKK